jgi:hypothetical protein
VKTGCSLAESSKEGYGSERAVSPMMMMKMQIHHLQISIIKTVLEVCFVMPERRN